MAIASDPNERFEGVDRGVLDEDTWAEPAETMKCPGCNMRVPLGTIRCPRCNRFLLMGCSGSCSGCGSRTCVRTGGKASR